MEKLASLPILFICGGLLVDIVKSLISAILEAMSFTYKPKKKKRATTHGFLARTKSASGKKVLTRRRQKGRRKLAV